MYRIMLAVNGYYYVQKKGYSGWKKTGAFFNTRRAAERLISDLKQDECQCLGKVVGYY